MRCWAEGAAWHLSLRVQTPKSKGPRVHGVPTIWGHVGRGEGRVGGESPRHQDVRLAEEN